MKRLLFVAALVAGCNNNVINTPIRVLDRPSDVALTCVQAPPPVYPPGQAPPTSDAGVEINNPSYELIYQVHPLSDCDPNSAQFNQFYDPNTGNVYPLRTRAVVANSATGEIALVDVDGEQIIDLNPKVPGFNFLPVGRLPEHVRVSPEGCEAVTTNSDSCDLAIVDLARLHNAPRLSELGDAGSTQFFDAGAGYATNLVRRMVPTVNGRPLGARPTWIEYAPDYVPQTPQPGYCAPTMDAKGNVVSQSRAWVAMPGCQLVAEVKLDAGAATVPDPNNPQFDTVQSAEVVRALRITRTGAEEVTDLTSISCPAECSGGAGTPANGGPADLGAGGSGPSPDGGLFPTAQATPSTLAIDAENGVGRLVVGDSSGEKIWIVPIATAAGQGALGPPRAVTLEHGAAGVNVVRISPRTQSGKFLYAVARDQSVRVVDLDREVECETNPDPRTPFLQSMPPADPTGQARQLGCFPLGDPSTPPRAPDVTTPGIVLQNGALPKDVSFVHLDVPPPPTDPSVAPGFAGPNLIVGDYAWVVGSDGRGTIVNIFDACPAPNLQAPNTTSNFTPACLISNVGQSVAQAATFAGQPQPLELERLSHRPRQGNNRVGASPVNCTDNGGAPRIQDEGNACTVSVNGVPSGGCTVVGSGSTSTGTTTTAPGAVTTGLPTLLQQMLPTVSMPTCTSTSLRSMAVYDPDRIRNENWDLLWEGLIPTTNRSTLAMGASAHGDLGGRGPDVVVDPGLQPCNRGVEDGDKIFLTGCQVNTDCDYTQTCVTDPAAPPEVTAGMCLDTNNMSALQNVCSILLRAVKRYRIQHVFQSAPLPGGGEVSDYMNIAEIYEPEHASQTHNCTENADCSDVNIAGPKDVTGAPTSLPTSCLVDVDGEKRCLRECDPNALGKPESTCGQDFVCVGPTVTPTGVQYKSSFLNDLITKNGQPAETGRCMRAPIDDALFAQCFAELQPYEIHTGESFAVVGSSSGFFNDLEPDPVTHECRMPPVSDEYVRLHQSRIPVAEPQLVWCPPSEDPRHLHTSNLPASDPRSSYDPLASLDPSLPNSCLDPGPPGPGCAAGCPSGQTCFNGACATVCDPTPPPAGLNGRPGLVPKCGAGEACIARSDQKGGICLSLMSGRDIHFENPFYAIEVVLPSSGLVPPDITDLKFVVVGGGFPLAVPLGIDVQAQQPRAVVTGPDRQTIFVVDEGKSVTATGLRGQLLRVSTSVQQTDRTFQVR